LACTRRELINIPAKAIATIVATAPAILTACFGFIAILLFLVISTLGSVI
jgi:hypothetical protein